MAIRGTVVYCVVHRLPMYLMQELNVGTVHLEQLAPSLRLKDHIQMTVFDQRANI